MKIKMWIEEGVIKCASQLCDDCSEIHHCQDGIIINPPDGYWQSICEIQEKQTKKGLNKYKMNLESNTSMDMLTRIQYLEEELIDGLMYIEHIKNLFKTMGVTTNE